MKTITHDEWREFSRLQLTSYPPERPFGPPGKVAHILVVDENNDTVLTPVTIRDDRPLTKDRAQEIWEHRPQFWGDTIGRMLSPMEKLTVADTWKTMPGYTCWANAFFRVLRGETETI